MNSSVPEEMCLPFRPAPAAVAPNEAEHNVDICSKPPDLSLRKPAADMASSNVSKFKLNSLVIEFNEIVLKTLKAGGPFHNNGSRIYCNEVVVSLYAPLVHTYERLGRFAHLLSSWGHRATYFHTHTLQDLANLGCRKDLNHPQYVSSVRRLLNANGDLDDKYLLSFVDLAEDLEEVLHCVMEAYRFMESIVHEGNRRSAFLTGDELKKIWVFKVRTTSGLFPVTDDGLDYVTAKQMLDKFPIPLWKAILLPEHDPARFFIQKYDFEVYQRALHLMTQVLLKAWDCHDKVLELGGLATRLQPDFEKFRAFVEAEEAKITGANAQVEEREEAVDTETTGLEGGFEMEEIE